MKIGKVILGLLKNPQYATPALPAVGHLSCTRDSIPLLRSHNKSYWLDAHEISGALGASFTENVTTKRHGMVFNGYECSVLP